MTDFCTFAFMFATRRFIVSLLISLAICSSASAAGGVAPGQKHMLRLGWGDMMYEHAVYSPTAKHIFDNPAALPDNYRVREAYCHQFTGHFFAEYQYSLKERISIGAQLDFSGMSWQNGIFDRYHAIVLQEPDSNYYNITFLPTARVTYLNKGPVSLYSGLGAGVLLSVSDSVEAAFALNVNLIGLQAGYGHWYGSLELGLLNAFTGLTKIYMIGSRIISLSINYAW